MKNVVNETMETSNQLFEIVDFGKALSPLKNIHTQRCGCGGYGYMEIDYLESDHDGVFPTKASWTKYANSVDADGGSYILSKMLGGSKKLKGDIGYCQVEREAWYEDNCTMSFKEPIKMVVGGYRSGEGKWIDIIEEVDYLKGEITYGWIWSSGDERASAIEIYLHIKDYGKLDDGYDEQKETYSVYAISNDGSTEIIESGLTNSEAKKLKDKLTQQLKDGVYVNTTTSLDIVTEFDFDELKAKTINFNYSVDVENPSIETIIEIQKQLDELTTAWRTAESKRVLQKILADEKAPKLLKTIIQEHNFVSFVWEKHVQDFDDRYAPATMVSLCLLKPDKRFFMLIIDASEDRDAAIDEIGLFEEEDISEEDFLETALAEGLITEAHLPITDAEIKEMFSYLYTIFVFNGNENVCLNYTMRINA